MSHIRDYANAGVVNPKCSKRVRVSNYLNMESAAMRLRYAPSRHVTSDPHTSREAKAEPGTGLQGADAVVAHLVRDDPERGHLGLGEPDGEGRGHRPGSRQVPAPGNGCLAIGGALPAGLRAD